MRKSRTKIRRENKGNKYLLIFLFIIILPVISIIPGYFGSKYLITPKLFSEVDTKTKDNLEIENQTKTSENSSDVAKDDTKVISETKEVSETMDVSETKKSLDESMNLKGFDFYSIQVGSFSSKENANELIEILKQKNMGYHVFERNGFKVVTASLMDRSQAGSLLADIKKSYEESFIVATSVPNKKIEFNSEEIEKIQLLNSNNDQLIKNIKALSDATFNLKTNGLSQEEYKAVLNSFNAEILQMIKTFSTLEVSTDLTPIFSNYTELLNKISKNIDLAINGTEETMLLSGKNLLSTSLFDYFEFASSNN